MKAARSNHYGLEVLLYSYVTARDRLVESVAVHRYHGGLETLLYSYVKASAMKKKNKGMLPMMNVLSEDIGMVEGRWSAEVLP